MSDQEKSENEIGNQEGITEGKSGGPYSEAISEYLDGADWLDPILDRPLMVHARSIAASLDLQMIRKGEIQSALAGSFDKALFRLDARRPKAPGDPAGGDPHQSTVFDFLSD